MSSNKMVHSESTYNPITKIWSGKKSSYRYPSDSSVGSVLLECLRKHPEHINQICFDNDKHYTNLEIAEKAISVSIHFKKLGLKHGEVVGLCATNSDFLAPLFIGALINGLVVNALDVTFSKDGIKHMYSITTPSIVFCDGFVYEHVRESCEEIGLKCVIYTLTDHLSGVPNINEFLTELLVSNQFRPEPLPSDSSLTPAIILCSSGTTGPSKGVTVTHAGLLSFSLEEAFVDGRILLCFSSLYWGSGMLSLISGCQNGFTRLITRKKFDAELFLDIVEKYKATILLTPPTQMALLSSSPTLYKRVLSSVKTYFVGGSVVSPALVAKLKPFMKTSNFVMFYGMSEMPGVGISSGIGFENGSTGKLVKNVELRIINDDGHSLGPNESGEILVRNNLPFMGYYRNSEATAQCCDKDGWIHTGDIGYMNENNELFVVDRKKEIFKYNNFHFSPSEIESVIYQIPDILEVCVTGIPDDIYTFLPAALIVIKPESFLKENDVIQYVAERLDDFKQLRGGVYFFNEIPKTASGKHIRQKVTEILLILRGELHSNNNKGK